MEADLENVKCVKSHTEIKSFLVYLQITNKE